MLAYIPYMDPMGMGFQMVIYPTYRWLFFQFVKSDRTFPKRRIQKKLSNLGTTLKLTIKSPLNKITIRFDKITIKSPWNPIKSPFNPPDLSRRSERTCDSAAPRSCPSRGNDDPFLGQDPGYHAIAEAILMAQLVYNSSSYDLWYANNYNIHGVYKSIYE